MSILNKTSLYEVENSFHCDYVTYYDRKLKRFKNFKVGRKIAEKYVLAPFREHYKRLAWEYFHESLNEEEKKVAYAYTRRHGYFNYLEEVGLIGTFLDAEDRARHEYFATWENANALSIDWDTVTIV